MTASTKEGKLPRKTVRIPLDWFTNQMATG